jgi:hypothetical protein
MLLSVVWWPPPMLSVTSSPVNFDVSAARMGTERAVPLQEVGEFVQHVVEAPGLLATGRPCHAAVHRVARLKRDGPAGRCLLGRRGQRLPDPARAHPGNEGKPAWDGTRMIQA